MVQCPNVLCTSLLLLLLASATKSHTHSTHIYKPPMSFLHLIGARKGDDELGIGGVKNYLHRFGYLNDFKFGSAHLVDQFDESLERAVLAYQGFFNLEKTGVLDCATVYTMSKPRCGNPDIVNDTMDFRIDNLISRHYVLYPGKPRRRKRILFFKIDENVPQQFRNAILQAFHDWQPFVPFLFLNGGVSTPDIDVGFYTRNHGDNIPFDGPDGILAHSTVVYGSDLHFDAEENWQVGAVAGAYDIGTTARHEIGHSLGLGHSDVQGALMNPIIDKGKVLQIGNDDKDGIKALYWSHC